MRIGELAEKTGVSASTIRYYEAQGILPKPKRRDSGYRIYDTHSAQVIMLTRYALELGFSLQELQALLSEKNDKGRLIAAVEDKIEQMERRIAKLKTQKDELKQLQQSLSEHWQEGECLPTKLELP